MDQYINVEYWRNISQSFDTHPMRMSPASHKLSKHWAVRTNSEVTSITNFSNSASKTLTYSFAMKQQQVEKSFQNSCFVHGLCPFLLRTPFLRLSLISLNPNLLLPLALSRGILRAFPGGSVGKESACNARDSSLIPGLGRSPGEGNGNLLQHSCLGNLMDKEAWQTTVHGVARVRHNLVIKPPHHGVLNLVTNVVL